MDDTGGLGGLVARMDRPGAAFVRPSREEGSEAHQVVDLAGQDGEAALLEPHALHEVLAVGGVGNVGQVGLELPAYHDVLGLLLGGNALHGLHILVRAGGNRVLVDVADEDLGLYGQEVQVVDGGLLVVGQVGHAGPLAVLQEGLYLCDRTRVAGELLLLLLAHRADGLGHLLLPLGDRVQVGLGQLVVYRQDVALRVNRRVGLGIVADVLDVRVVKAADDVGYDRRLADVREELVPQALALARPLYEAGYIDEIHGGGDLLFGLEDGGHEVKPLVGQVNDPHVGVNRAERIVLGGGRSLGKGRENRGLADVRQPDYATSKFHIQRFLEKIVALLYSIERN